MALRDRFRKEIAVFADLFAKLISIRKPAAPKFRSQRMCPFCSLITPRSGPVCLECGKSFGNG
jgi:hypothetical protein